MDVRKIEAADLAAVVDLFLLCYGEGWTREQAERYLTKFYGFEPESCLVGLSAGGEILGGVLAYSYQRGERPVIFVQELFVHPDHRSRGWGRRLLAALRERFESPRVDIKPLVNAPSGVLAFYNSVGFEKEESFTFYDE